MPLCGVAPLKIVALTALLCLILHQCDGKSCASDFVDVDDSSSGGRSFIEHICNSTPAKPQEGDETAGVAAKILLHATEKRALKTLALEAEDSAAVDSAMVQVGAGGELVNVGLVIHRSSDVHRTGSGTWIITVPEGCTKADLAKLKHNMPVNSTARFVGGPDDRGLCVFMMNGTKQQIKEELETHDFSSKPLVETDSVFDPIPEMPLESSSLLERSQGMPWGLDRIDDREGLNDAYSPEFSGKGVHVFVFDSGVRVTHADFGGRAVPTLEVRGWGGAVECDANDTTCAADKTGHGTHCAGTIGGKMYGVAKDVRLHAVKVVDEENSGFSSYFVEAMNVFLAKVADRNWMPAVASVSMGGPGNSASVGVVVDSAVRMGVTVVASAGNDGRTSNYDACRHQPGYLPSSITVGATDAEDRLASYSNRGPCVDIFAPGSFTTSAGHESDDQERVQSGTSMACPHVSGAVALLLSEDPTLTPQAVRDELIKRATPDVVSNAGSSSPNRLLYVGAGKPLPSPSPTPSPAPVPVTSGN